MNSLTAFLKLDTAGYSSAIAKSEQEAKRLEKSFTSLESSSGGVSSAMTAIASSAVTMVAGFVGISTITAGIEKLVSVSREFDVLNAGLVTVTGSAEGAKVAFKAIEEFASSTPYSIAQATEAFTKLANYGLTPSEKALTSYGNTAAAMGKDLSQMVEAVADAASGQFERLKEFGIKSSKEGDNVSFTFQGVTTTVKNSAAEIEKYLIGIGEVEFGGSMANRMATLDGLISNLGDQWDTLFRNISSQGIGDIMSETVAIGVGALEGLNALLASGQLEAYLQSMVASWAGWGDAIGTAITSVRNLFTIETDAMSSYWGTVVSFLSDAFSYFPQNVKAYIGLLVVDFASAFDKIKIYATGLKEQIAAIFNNDTADAAYNRMQQGIANVTSARNESIDAILNEREKAIASADAQKEKAAELRKTYDDNAAAAKKDTTDTLAQFGKKVTATQELTEATKKNGKAVKDTGMEYASLSQEFMALKESGANLGSQLQLLEKMKGIDVLSDSVKEAQKETEKLEKSTAKQVKTVEQLKEEYRTLRLETGSFFDGFTVGIEDAIDSISTMGELGKETFDTLYSSWKDGFYAVITGDMDGLSDVWDSLLSSLLRQFSDFVAGLLLKWAAAEFLNINIGVNGTSLSSGASALGSLASLFSGEDASSQSWSGSENASYYASGASTLGQQGSGMLATGAGYLGMGVGAYGVYSGLSDMSKGNYGTGALKTGLGGVSMYKGAVAAGLLDKGTATAMAKSWGAGIKGYFAEGAATEIGTEIGAAATAEWAQTAYVAGKGATSYATFQSSASAAPAVGAGAGYAAILPAIAYLLNNIGGETPTVSPSDAMNSMGMTPEDLAAFSNGWQSVANSVLDLDESLSSLGVGMQTIGEATYDASEGMLYYTNGLGIMGSAFDVATQTWSEASAGMLLDATQLGNSAQVASSQTVAAAAEIMSSYTGTSTSMSTAAEIANAAANAYQDLAVSESGSTTYAIELQWTLQAMGLSASEAAAAADELIAQMESEANATSAVADTASTATGMLGGMATAISETATAATSSVESISSLSSSLGGFTSSASSASESLRKAIGSWGDVISSGGSRSADTSEHAAGGVFTRPVQWGSHLIGEAGPEALVPLTEGPDTLGMIIDKLDVLASSGSGVIHAHFNVDGKEMARVVMPFVDKQVTAQAQRGVLGSRTAY